MKQKLMVCCCLVVCLGGFSFGADSVAVRLYNVTQDVAVPNGAEIYTHIDDTPILYRIELSIENDDPVHGMSLGLIFAGDEQLRINWEEQPDGITRGGADYSGFLPVTVEDDCRLDPDSGGTGSFDFFGLMVNPVNADGIPVDSILVGGNRRDNLLPAGPMDHMINYYFTLGLNDANEAAFAVDSGKVGPGGDFVFSDASGTTYVPGFSGVLSFSVTPGGGIILDAGGEDARPNVFSLAQNYPNPFNPTTRIDYCLPRASHVSIDIYNVLGQQVTTLIDGEQAAGEHTITWNGDDSNGDAVASGIYFYRMTGDEFVETRKMVLMR